MVCNQTFSFIFLFLSLQVAPQILDPDLIQKYQFTEQITGIPNILEPINQIRDAFGKITQQTYQITMKRISQHLLPRALKLNPTELFVYGGRTKDAQIYSFPAPALIAKQGVPIKVIWKNDITGKHLFTVDVSPPFKNQSMFINEVPTVPHAHGLVTPMGSDGGPQAFWTAEGSKSKDYHTEEDCQKNEAVYKYTNEQQPGLYWYHDHTYGITRLNVYAGLAGFYEIIENPEASGPSLGQRNLKKAFGDLETRYFGISDKTFQTDGQLYYPDKAISQKFTSWIPEFYGNTIVVNQKVWPKIVLQKKIYRLIFLNACQCRYLNLFFLNNGKKLPFKLVRAEGDFFPNPIISTQYFLSLGARIQIILDLTQINGEVILRNNAQAPHPNGDPQNLVESQTGSIMKIQILNQVSKKLPFLDLHYIRTDVNEVILKENSKYPAFGEGEKVFTTLHQFMGQDDESLGMMIDGYPMELSMDCSKSQVKKFQAGKVYDFYIINLTPDTHPIHFHLVNIQKVMSFPFDVQSYTNDWYELNGEIGERGYDKITKMLDPELYRTGNNVFPKTYEKIFRDVIDAFPDMVTVLRMRFSHNNGEPYTFNVSKMRYVWHCHMLEHEDNEMMKYFCME